MKGIRRLAAEKLKLPTSNYQFVGDDDFQSAVENLGIPCVIKPIMSSSWTWSEYLKKQRRPTKSMGTMHNKGEDREQVE